jgi:hypothetical protein
MEYAIFIKHIIHLRTMNRIVQIRTSILASIVLVTTLMILTSPTVYAASPDLTIVDFGEVGDSQPFLTVKGTAGGTVPDQKGDIYVYGFDTDDGIFAAISDGGEWQAVQLELSKGFCITSQTPVSAEVLLDGNKLTIEGIDAVQVASAFTAVFSTGQKDTSGEEDVKDATCLVKKFSGTLPEID